MAATNHLVDDTLIAKVTEYVKAYMANYDPSHDYSHIQRVVRLAQAMQPTVPNTHAGIVTLAALLHDVGDKKYLRPGEDGSRLVHALLTSLGAGADLAETVQAICLGVSYSGEARDPARVAALIRQHPELAVVQDADRLDAIGAVGIGRAFTFGGAKNQTMETTMAHFADKLVRLEGLMKTDAGRAMARERTARIQQMQQWWALETEVVP
ncbi:hypothetical protein S7711_04629 [Stachybotrys chartarum IBT 7711]|jgi:uncharacterized protein|uniref:HD domain-containing protein n=1 Tax=Stachybotrys chartarum (strain CBS 109288 / IBT 7711) TaxID=1280523 RepID=A0A084AUI5_STACB|nr:hypothetical protein S7711_04629 [Stachybotrys chartarum IBT 7711]KFA52066.1 hypothetical protein S40293_02971 [Stachybotrys chartarum IBT 40293]KFA75629.1 hypothetical protein S40288_05922 [Stachybotrys chartarum IBT 40288]